MRVAPGQISARALALVMAGAVLLAACGSGSSGPDDAGTEQETTDNDPFTPDDGRPVRPDAGCAAGLVSGFVMTQADDGVTLVPESSPGTVHGTGLAVAPSLGQLRDADVVVELADGRVFGPIAVDARDGMVTLVPCDYTGPAFLTVAGRKPQAAYYDVASARQASFSGQQLRAALDLGAAMAARQGIGVTPLTDAAVELLAASAEQSAAVPWHDVARVGAANERILQVINSRLPGSQRISDITRRPVLLDARNARAGSGALGDDEASRYAAVLAGFARIGAVFRPGDPSPTLTMSGQFRHDLADGRLDMRRDGRPVAAATGLAYTYDALTRMLGAETEAAGRLFGGAAHQTLHSPLAANRWTFGTIPLHGYTSVGMTLAPDGTIIVQRSAWWDVYPDTTPTRQRIFAGFDGAELLHGYVLAGDRKRLLDFTNSRDIGLLDTDFTLYSYEPIPDPLVRQLVPAGSPRTVTGWYESQSSGWSAAGGQGRLLYRLSDGSFFGIPGVGHETAVPFPVPAGILSIVDEATNASQGEGDGSAPPVVRKRTFGLTAEGRVLVWNTGEPDTVRALPLEGVVSIEQGEVTTIHALTADGQVYWINRDNAVAADTDELLFPDSPPFLVGGWGSGHPGICQLGRMGYVLDCEGFVWSIAEDCELLDCPPLFWGSTALDQAVPGEPITAYRRSQIAGPVWRVYGEGSIRNAMLYTSGTGFLGVDGRTYDEQGMEITLP